jgi:ribulose-bisphosphate carboxylase small chain
MGITIIRNSDSATVMYELSECRKAHPNVYIKLNCFNNARCVESTALSFIANRPSFEPGFYLVRQEGRGRNIVYTIQSYAVQSAAEGARY